MADKEERITIHQVLYPCKKCSINCNKKDWKDCDFYQNYISGMTRAEAIERMKNAGLKYACRANGRDIPEEVHHHYANMMEAALDALLGGKK